MSTILVPTSGVVPAEGSAEYISRIAKSLGASIIVLHVHPNAEPTAAGHEAANVLSQAAKTAGIQVRTMFQQGSPVETIIATAREEQVSLVLMGVSQGALVQEWVSSNVLHESELPVVVIPHALA